jgi:hypothetical protein
VRKALITIGSVLVALVACSAIASENHRQATGASSSAASTTEVAPSAPAQAGSISQRNALRSAQSYIEMSGFSRLGLIDQLSSSYGEGFSKADATWAVDRLDVDWNEQAVRGGKSYLDMSGFSRAGLIEQLSSDSGEQFTKAQAAYAADKLGL